MGRLRFRHARIASLWAAAVIGLVGLTRPVAAVAEAGPTSYSTTDFPAADRLFGVGSPLEPRVKRDASDECAKDYYNCSSLGAPGLCCRSDQACARDSDGNVGCCPVGAACSGTVPSTISYIPSTTNGAETVLMPAVTASDLSSSTSTAPAAGSASLVANGYFPFPYIATTYANAAGCSSAWSVCQTNSAVCLSVLTAATINDAAGRGGVTVQAPNGGVTVVAGSSFSPSQLPSSSASAVCSSLSAQACFGLEVESCTRYGGGDSDFVVGNGAGSGRSASMAAVSAAVLAALFWG